MSVLLKKGHDCWQHKSVWQNCRGRLLRCGWYFSWTTDKKKSAWYLDEHLIISCDTNSMFFWSKPTEASHVYILRFIVGRRANSRSPPIASHWNWLHLCIHTYLTDAIFFHLIQNSHCIFASITSFSLSDNYFTALNTYEGIISWDLEIKNSTLGPTQVH